MGWMGWVGWMDGWAGRAVVTANVGLHAGRWIPRTTLFHTCGCGLRGIIHTLLATSRPRNPYLATPSSFITPSWTHACEKITHPLPLTRRHALGKTVKLRRRHARRHAWTRPWKDIVLTTSTDT